MTWQPSFRGFGWWLAAGLLALASLACDTAPAATTPTAAPAASAAGETPRPVREWNVEGVQIEGETVRVLVRVFSTASIVVTLDGQEGTEDSSGLPILAYTFTGVKPGEHDLEILNQSGTYRQQTKVFVTEKSALAATGGATPTPGATVTALPAGAEEVPLMPDRQHRPMGQAITDYSTLPPTSGPHWPQWRACGVYTSEAPDELIVHNLEHGNIVINHHLTDPAAVAQLKAVAEAIPEFAQWGIMRPYPALPEGSIVLTGWGIWARLDSIDAPRIAQFFAAYAGERSPEVIPCNN